MFLHQDNGMSDRKRMKKLRKKRIVSIEKQIEEHKDKIINEPGRLSTTKDYWQKEIDEKFVKQLKKDEEYLEENNGDSDKKSN